MLLDSLRFLAAGLLSLACAGNVAAQRQDSTVARNLAERPWERGLVWGAHVGIPTGASFALGIGRTQQTNFGNDVRFLVVEPGVKAHRVSLGIGLISPWWLVGGTVRASYLWVRQTTPTTRPGHYAGFELQTILGMAPRVGFFVKPPIGGRFGAAITADLGIGS